jgi:hypothetical protein
MKTKIVNGDFHLKDKRYCFIGDKVMPISILSGKLRVIHDNRTTYVVCPIGDKMPYEGIMIPIIEDYDSLEEIK